MATRQAFLSDERHRIRFVYTPKHSSWLNQIEIVFGIVHRKCVRRGSCTSVSDLEAQLRAFLGYYNQTMAHPFAWAYDGQPRTRPGRATFVPPHRRASLGRLRPLAGSAASCPVA